MISTLFALALALDSGQAQSEDFVLRARSGDVASIVQSLYDATGEPVVFYYDAASSIPDLNLPVATIEDLQKVMREELKLEVLILDEGIAVGPIAPHYYEYQFNLWAEPIRTGFVKQLLPGNQPRTTRFAAGIPTYCIPSNFLNAADQKLEIHPMYESTSLCIIGQEFTIDSLFQLIASAVGGQLVIEDDQVTLVPDPQAILSRMDSVPERFPDAKALMSQAHWHSRYILTARLLSKQIGNDRIEEFFSKTPGSHHEKWAVSSLDSELQELVNKYVESMTLHIREHLPAGLRGARSVNVMLTPFGIVSIEVIRSDGQRVVF